MLKKERLITILADQPHKTLYDIAHQVGISYDYAQSVLYRKGIRHKLREEFICERCGKSSTRSPNRPDKIICSACITSERRKSRVCGACGQVKNIYQDGVCFSCWYKLPENREKHCYRTRINQLRKALKEEGILKPDQDVILAMYFYLEDLIKKNQKYEKL